MYPICYQWVSGRYLQPEPTMYSRCFCWFPGPLAPSVCGLSSNMSVVFLWAQCQRKQQHILSADVYGCGIITVWAKGCWQLSNWVIVPRLWPIGQENTAWEWLDWLEWLDEKGQGKLMGSLHYPRFPFILIKISQLDLSPLLDLYSADPLIDLKPHTGTGAVVFFSLSWFSQPTMLMWLCSMFKILCHVLHHITSFFCDHDVSAYCQPHSIPLFTHSLLFPFLFLFLFLCCNSRFLTQQLAHVLPCP